MGKELAKEMLRKDDNKTCDEKELRVSKTLLKRSREKYHTVWVEMKLRLILYWLVITIKVFKSVKAIPWELHHRLVVTDMDKRKLRKVVKNEQTIRRRV